MVAAAVSVILLCSALAVWTASSGGSGAECGVVAPGVEPARAGPGEAFVLSGGGFAEGCSDTGPPFPEEPPQRGIRIEMRQEGKTWGLATVDAGGPPRYFVEATLEVPKDAEPGGAVVAVHTANMAEPMEVPFEVLGGGTR